MKGMELRGADAESRQSRMAAVCILAACGVALFLSAVTVFLERFSFATADEAWMAFALAGGFSNRPAVWVPYLSPVLTRGFALLYSWAPGVPWYVLFHIVMIAVSMAVINTCVMARARKHFPDSTLVPGALFCLLADLPLCWALSRLTLYHVAAVTGAAVLCLLLDRLEGRRFAGSAILMIVLSFVSVSCAPIVGGGLAVCAFAIAACLYLKQKGDPNRGRIAVRGACLVLAMGVLLAGTLVVTRRERDRLCGDGYVQWSAARDAFIDGAPGSHEDYQAACKRAGWSEELGDLVARNFLMDRQFDAKAVSKIVGRDGLSTASSWNDLVKAAGALADGSARGLALGMAVLLHAACLVCVLLRLRRDGRGGGLKLPLACVILADVLFLLLARKGSLNYESAFVVGVPCLAVLMLSLTDIACAFAVDFRAQGENEEKDIYKYGEMLLMAAVSVIAVAAGLGMYMLNGHAVSSGAVVGIGTSAVAEAVAQDPAAQDPAAPEFTPFDELQNSGALNKADILPYLSGHSSTLFVCDEAVLANLNVIHGMKTGKLSNLYCWSQSQRYSFPYNRQQRLNGLKKPLYAEDFGRDDVCFISASLDNIRLLHRYLSDNYGLHACTVSNTVLGDAWVVKFRKDYDIDEEITAPDAPAGVSICDEDGQISEYTPVESGKGKRKTAQWMGQNEFIVNYHLTPDDKATSQKTRVTYGSPTPTLSCMALGFYREGYRFVGWNAYRSDTDSWWVRDADGIIQWRHDVGEGDGDYLQYKEGIELSTIADPGTVIDFYAVWRKADTYSVVYHKDMKADAFRRARNYTGKDVAIMPLSDIGGYEAGKRFVGWRAYRTDTQSWSVIGKKNRQAWKQNRPDEEGYWVYADGASLGETLPAGAELHLYAQWENTDSFTVYYHNDDGVQSPITTQVVYGVQTAIEKVDELGFEKENQRFAGWRVYRSDTRQWIARNRNKKGGIWTEDLEDMDYMLWQDGHTVERLVPAGVELHFYAQWKDIEAFTVYYHRDSDSPGAQKTVVEYGVSTPTLTWQALGFGREGQRFVGWRVYRTDTGEWLARDERSGEAVWMKESKVKDYVLWKNGRAVKRLVPAGAEVHLYGQWEDTDEFTVFYHRKNGASANSKTTAVRCGTPTRTLTPQELGFFAEGKRFAGWRMYRNDCDCWGVIDAQGNSGWARELPEGGQYWLYGAGWALSEAVPAGYGLHLYAQWTDTDSYTVYYHESDDAPAAERATEVRTGEPVASLTPQALGYDLQGRRFMGWKVYRADKKQWWISNAAGEDEWANALPVGSGYRLQPSGFLLQDIAKAGAEVHLYAQWADSFTVYYHLTDDSPACELTTKINYGSQAVVESLATLGFENSGKAFAGWRACCRDTDRWLKVGADGEARWADPSESEGAYWLIADGGELPAVAEPGTQVHLYAQWK